MAVSLQVLYPTDNNTTFNENYYLSDHMDIVGQHFGPHIQSTLVAKGVAGGPGTPAGFHFIATLVFADQSALDAALAAAGPVIADIPNFYDGAPKMLIGEVVG